MGTSPHSLPGWVLLWHLVTGIVCTWDASFILLRPKTLPGGSYHWLWKPYSLYIEVDKRYGDMADTFVYAVSLMNLCEVVLSFLVIFLNASGNKKAAPLAFTTSVMIWWKTVLYMLQYMEFVGGGEYSAHNDLYRTVVILWLPNIVWIIVPFLVMVKLWPRLVNGPNELNRKTNKTRKD